MAGLANCDGQFLIMLAKFPVLDDVFPDLLIREFRQMLRAAQGDFGETGPREARMEEIPCKFPC